MKIVRIFYVIFDMANIILSKTCGNPGISNHNPFKSAKAMQLSTEESVKNSFFPWNNLRDVLFPYTGNAVVSS